MAENKKYYWLKLNKDFLKSRNMKVVKNMQNGKDYIIFYLSLLLESLETVGYLRFSDLVPYDNDMLASITDTNRDIVSQAVGIFRELGLIEVLDNGTIYMTQVSQMTGSESESAKRVRKHRENQTLLEDGQNTKTLQCNSDVTECNAQCNIEYRDKSIENRDKEIRDKEIRERDNKEIKDKENINTKEKSPQQPSSNDKSPQLTNSNGDTPQLDDSNGKEPQSTSSNDGKIKEKQIQYADYVSMTETEYNKLLDSHGKEFVDKCIYVLDNYKGSIGKKYKSDYRAILTWVVDKVKKETPAEKKIIPDDNWIAKLDGG